jgi:hypothetical protein
MFCSTGDGSKLLVNVVEADGIVSIVEVVVLVRN